MRPLDTTTPTTIIMVRVKNRYLLVNILYPELEKNTSKTIVPDVVAFNQPTTNALTPQVLLRAIRAEVAELFGDYGSGAISDSLSGQSIVMTSFNNLTSNYSKISVTSDVYLHTSSFTCALQDCVGCAVIYEQYPCQEWQEMRLSSCEG